MYQTYSFEAYKTSSALDLSHPVTKPFSSNAAEQSTINRSRKRKHDEITRQNDIGDPFTVKVVWSLELALHFSLTLSSTVSFRATLGDFLTACA
jgi:hypothetical protein